MSFFELLESSPRIFGFLALILFCITLIAFLFNFNFKFRSTGATIFALLLSISSWAFIQSYNENIKIEGAIYAPIVYDNGFDLIIAKAKEDFPKESIEPTLKQLAENLKKGSRSGAKVKIRIRGLERISQDTSKPIILGEIEKSFITKVNTND